MSGYEIQPFAPIKDEYRLSVSGKKILKRQ